MKKIIFLFFMFTIFYLFADDYIELIDYSQYYSFSKKEYKTLCKTNLYDDDYHVSKSVEKERKFNSSKFAYVQNRENQPFDTFDYLIGFENGWISVDNIILTDSEILPESIVTNCKNRFEKMWIPSWYNKLINEGKKLEDYSFYHGRNKNSFEYKPWRLHNIEFRNTFLIIYAVANPYFSIKNITKKNNAYYVHCEIEKSGQEDFNAFFTKESFSNLPNVSENRNCTFIIEQNGNRLRLYNGENYKLITELMRTDKTWNDSMIEYINSDYKNKPPNLKPIEEKLAHPWSDHKTGLYEESFANKVSVLKSSSNVTNNKTMTVRENLKLRSGEATSTQVLAVMQAGTKVRILEVGKAETINGISSNWVKVEVQKGAKDRDGKPIKRGTVGWCYSGYLE
ncbi:MAG: SH3 domain-containing protein [Treponema sp.]|uniref:SH3 domain-containing protein n=1 Tax=Treponema sp. TaxID=166 RepID=UPI0025F0E8B9|nr:SH3 domain-containing protein [Treponema sp.]MBQ8680601.1 SH3 domain-containing protein [Treponema sp.]